jgi:hypothetical protein
MEEAERLSGIDNQMYEQSDNRRKSTYELDWEENSPGFDDLFFVEDFADIKSRQNRQEEKLQPQERTVNVQQHPILPLYDLFGMPQAERK